LPTMGGQTGLNCALDLVREGVLEKYGVEMIAASREAIDMAEDRELFRDAMREIGLETARAAIAHSLEEAIEKQQDIGYPTIIRPSFTLGGTGGGIAYNQEEFHTYFRVFETADDYFPYYRKYHAFWRMYGLDLPDEVLKKIYYQNALRLVPRLDASLFP